MKKSILFVCHGNICRSPMAEYIFKKLARKKFVVESRATSNEEIGNDMHEGTKEQLELHNIPYDRHSAKRITVDDYERFDIIICFDDYNIRNLRKITWDTTKVHKLLDKDIEDPWFTGDFGKVYNEIFSGCKALYEKLKDNN